jgi:proteasome lid subunit RPN8/RPN11
MAAYAQDRGLRILALFHSHPSGNSDLSAGDRAALRHSAWPWVIVTRPAGASTVVLTIYAQENAPG